MSSNVWRVAAEEGHQALPMPPIAYGLLAVVFFLVLLGVLWTFRNTGLKHVPPTASHGERTSHGTAGGADSSRRH